MVRHSRRCRIVLVAIAVAVVFPAVTWAGKKVVSGEQSLRLKVSLAPAKAGAHGVTLHFHSDYGNSKHPDQQPPYNTKTTTFTVGKGFSLNTSVVPRCKESKVIQANGNGSVCPSASKVGGGTVIVNARPAVKKLIQGTIIEYNGVDDGGYAGFPKGSPLLILYIKTSIGVNNSNYFHIVKLADGRTRLTGTATKPAKPGVTPGSYTLQKLDLTLSGSGKKPYLNNPGSCSGSWPFSISITNWFGQPSITATDSVKCHK